MIKTHVERLLYKNIYLSLYCKGSKRVVQSLRVRGSCRPNITEIFWPQSYGRQCCVFLVLHGCSTGALESTLLGAGFPYYISSVSKFLASTQLSVYWLVELNCPLFNSSALYYLQTPTQWYGHASAISSDVWRSGYVTSAFFGMACVIVIERI